MRRRNDEAALAALFTLIYPYTDELVLFQRYSPSEHAETAALDERARRWSLRLRGKGSFWGMDTQTLKSSDEAG